MWSPKQKKAYIIAEDPMESTARNMWKVIHDRKCGAIVMLSNLVENKQVSICFVFTEIRMKSITSARITCFSFSIQAFGYTIDTEHEKQPFPGFIINNFNSIPSYSCSYTMYMDRWIGWSEIVK